MSETSAAEAKLTRYAQYRRESGVNVRIIAQETGLTPQRLYQIEQTGICPSETASAIAACIARHTNQDPAQVFAACFFLQPASAPEPTSN